MNVERSPVINDVVVLWRHGDDAHLWMLAQQIRTVRHENPDSFFHGTLPAFEVSGFQRIGVRFKRRLSGRLVRSWVPYQPKHGSIPILTQGNAPWGTVSQRL